MMKKLLGALTLIGLIGFATGCKKSCLNCTIEHFDDLTIIAEVNDICGNDEDLKQEQDRLAIDYRCIQCVVFAGLSNSDTGIICGDVAFTDSVQASNEQAAIEIGANYTCELFADTLIIRCHPPE